MPFSAQRAGLLRGRSRTGCGSSRRRVRHVQAPRAPQLLVLICLPANRRICNLSGIQMPSGHKILGGFAGENPPQPRTVSYEGSPGRTHLNPGHTLRCGHLASLGPALLHIRNTRYWQGVGVPPLRTNRVRRTTPITHMRHSTKY